MGLTLFFWSKNGHFSNFFFFRQYRQGKYLSRAIKQEVQKLEKLLFLHGFTHGFAQKMAIFPFFFSHSIGQGKSLLRYSRTKKRLSRL